MSIPLQEIYQLEAHLDAGFKAMLSGMGAVTYTARESAIAETPRIEIDSTVGQASKHQQPFQSNPQTWVSDSWEGAVEVTISANRTTEKDLPNTINLIGLVRAKMQFWMVKQFWRSNILAICDCRETGTVDSFTDAENVDHITLGFFLVFNVQPGCFPASLPLTFP